MPRLKRTRDEAELDLPSEPPIAPELEELRSRLRNQWEFASLVEYIFLFGDAVKIGDIEIEDLEAECLKPTPSEMLPAIGLGLLKYVSSHRGLTPELFDEYTRRQYLAKAPQRNPFGDEEEPIRFNDLDVFTRIRVLHQLSIWTFGNVDRIRSLMPEEDDHLSWRMEPLGWDKEDRAYFVLDDNRLYRRTDQPVPPPSPKVKAKSKSKSKKKSKPVNRRASRGTRSSKRLKLDESEDDEEEPEAHDVEDEDLEMANGDIVTQEEEPGYGFTSKTWECIAVTLEDYQEFTASLFRSRDPNEKQLRIRIEEDVIPVIAKRAESLRQKQLKKIRELENLQRMATAKRSSRLADKADREKQDREEREQEEKRQRDLKMALEEQERQRKIEEGHESRRLTREQRLREREAKRILHEEELARLEEGAQRAESHDTSGETADSKRISERHLNNQREQHQRELERLAAEDEGKWYFDCSVCGMHGENLDDGTHSVACDRCNVWQHSKCHGFTPKQAEREGFVFICTTCRRKEEDAQRPKIPSLKLGKRPDESSPDLNNHSSQPGTANGSDVTGSSPSVPKLVPHVPKSDYHEALGNGSAAAGVKLEPPTSSAILNGPSLSPNGQASGPPGQRLPPVSNFSIGAPQKPWPGNALPPPSSPGRAQVLPVQNGSGSSLHQQQHQAAHQAAVASAGGHPPHSTPQMNPLARSPSMPPVQLSPNQPAFSSPQTTSTSGPGPLLTGFQSPVKQQHHQPSLNSSPPPSIKSSHMYSTPQQAYHPSIQHERSPQLQQSPKTALPPPPHLAQQQLQSGVSPVKSSPSAAVAPHTSFGSTVSSTSTATPLSKNMPQLAPQSSPQNGAMSAVPSMPSMHAPLPQATSPVKHAQSSSNGNPA